MSLKKKKKVIVVGCSSWTGPSDVSERDREVSINWISNTVSYTFHLLREKKEQYVLLDFFLKIRISRVEMPLW